jgi:hypothetical protein
MNEKPVLPTKPIYSVHQLELDFHGEVLEVKRIVRDKLKNSRLYGTKILLDDKNIGKVIQLKTLGNWAFGIPTFEGRLKFEELNNTLILKIPDGSPKIVTSLANKIKEVLHD